FDIDANGIVHVSAKDLGTGNAQQITITSSSNLSEAEIKKAMDEAERFANEDKAKKEEVEVLNQADSLIYQTERTLKDMDGKLDPADKAKIESELESFKKTRETNDTAAIKSASEAFAQATYEVFGKVYQQQQQQQAGAQPGGSGAQNASGVNDDGTVDGSFEE
ncbi:MAG: Hsp70 family protein, partial [Clostridia bacterium]|nr:Hsp70 family protein [Clostridia bacterium]